MIHHIRIRNKNRFDCLNIDAGSMLIKFWMADSKFSSSAAYLQRMKPPLNPVGDKHNRLTGVPLSMLIMLAIVLVLKILESFKSRNLEKMNTEKNESVQI
ncbi:hypothetical protein CUU63_07455 [Bacillus halotolerans]|uniref:Uncharacterized protein n=1 Tax=Bacillus halotolerans TaxID=260554 RepID=A0A9Q6A9W7_9BACI|nr:hypothetical protein CUU63_07455 [Bacillus halotolerans]